MKRYIASFLLLFPLISHASTESQDTIIAVDSPSKVLITESCEGTLITVTDNEKGKEESHFVAYTSGAKVSTSRRSYTSLFNIPDLDFLNNKYGRSNQDRGWTIGIDGLCIGLNQAHGQTGGGGLQWSKSFEISWLSCFNIGYAIKSSRIYLGLGFDWRNYKATADCKWLTISSNGGLEWGHAPSGAIVKSTNLKVFSLQLPLMYEWRIPKSRLKLKVGPILNFNTYSSVKGIYDNAEGNHCEYFRKDFDRNKVTLDIFGSLSYHNALGIYVRYSPMKVLKETSPINFTPFTVGVGFAI